MEQTIPTGQAEPAGAGVSGYAPPQPIPAAINFVVAVRIEQAQFAAMGAAQKSVLLTELGNLVKTLDRISKIENGEITA